MNRRDALRALLATLAVSPGVLPSPARAQLRVLRAVSVTGNSEQSIAPTLATFREELKALEYVEGRHLSFDFSAGEFSRERTHWSSTSRPRALGVKIPRSVLLRADRLIE